MNEFWTKINEVSTKMNVFSTKWINSYIYISKNNLVNNALVIMDEYIDLKSNTFRIKG